MRTSVGFRYAAFPTCDAFQRICSDLMHQSAETWKAQKMTRDDVSAAAIRSDLVTRLLATHGTEDWEATQDAHLHMVREIHRLRTGQFKKSELSSFSYDSPTLTLDVRQLHDWHCSLKEEADRRVPLGSLRKPKNPFSDPPLVREATALLMDPILDSKHKTMYSFYEVLQFLYAPFP